MRTSEVYTTFVTLTDTYSDDYINALDRFKAEVRSHLWYRAFESLKGEIDESTLSVDLLDLYNVYRDCQLFVKITKNVFREIIWYNKEGRFHRWTSGPAMLMKDGSRGWHKNGKYHRDGDNPAWIDTEGEYTWFKDGKIHRDDDKPAHIKGNYQEWYVRGKLHRKGDKPAQLDELLGFKVWYKHGKKHRSGGKPAIINPKYDYCGWYERGEMILEVQDPKVIELWL